MSSVVISGDTSGAITLSAPAVSGTNTATLPAATGTVMVSGNMPAFSAYASGTQTVSLTTWTKVTLGNEIFDTNNNFASSRFTPTVAGYYQINGFVRMAATLNLNRFIVGIWKNGAEYARPAEQSFSSNLMPQGQFGGGVIVYLNGSTDYVELYGYLNGSGTLTFTDDGASAYTSSMTGVLVRAA